MTKSHPEYQYLDKLREIYETGNDTGDRTGTGMRSLFGLTMQFDLREGFPLLTTKKMFTRGVFGELLWFLSGSTSNKELEKKYNIKFWREWQDEFQTLPNIYGKQWVRWEHRNIKRIERRIIKQINQEKKKIELLDVENSHDPNGLVGNIFQSKNHGDYRVIGHHNSYSKTKNPKGGRMYKIQFLRTGYVKDEVRITAVKNGNVEDPYFPTNEGVGFLGKYYFDTKDPLITHLKSVWRKMLNRCYSEKHVEYHNYGGKGIFVDERWHNFENFVDDVKTLPNWNLKIDNIKEYNLDKDYYGSNCYSKDTCVWLSIKDNTLYSTSIPFVYTDESGRDTIFLSKSECAEYLDVDNRRICDILNGKYIPKKYRHIKLSFLEYNNEKYVYRYELPFNQIQYIIDEIKTNSTSRRILFTGWNAPEMQYEDTALPCCHSTVVQFYVENGVLHMYHYQRSGDFFLGVPVNIASYATLLTMIAQQCDLIPGTMKHTVGVAHIYHNHMDQVKEQLRRYPYELPKLVIKRKPESIFKYELSDFEVKEYISHDKIHGDVAI
jgi:thymidylate synthase